MANTHSKQGFTLVEIAIVLVVIGLVVGGIAVGKDLIEASQTRKLYSELTQYESMVVTFKSRYGGYWPGDYPYAQQVISTETTSGDGSGDINSWPKAGHTWEGGLAWEHLSYSGIYPSELRCDETNWWQLNQPISDSLPIVPFNGAVFLVNHPVPGGSGFKHMFWVNSASDPNSLNGGGVLTNWQMKTLDMKFDDGAAYKGRIRARMDAGSGFNCVGPSAAYHDALDPGEPSCILAYMLEQ